MNKTTALNVLLLMLAGMSFIFMPLANRQSAWMMLVMSFIVSGFYLFSKDKLILSIKKSIVCKMSIIWIFIYTVYLIHIVINKGSDGVRIYYFSSIIWLILGVIFYALSLKDERETILRLMITVSMLLLVYFFVRIVYLYVLVGFNNSAEELKNTIPYYLMYLSIPVLLLKDKKKYIMLGLIVFFILFSTKRGPLLAMAISGFLTYFFMSKKNIVFKIVSVTSIVVTFVVLGLVIFPGIIDTFIQRFEVVDISSEQGMDALTSSRSLFWAILYMYWSESEITTYLFGFGLNAAPEYLEMLTYHEKRIFSHSDWVDTMFNLGWLGLLVFFLFHVSLVYEIVRAVKVKNQYAKYMLYGYMMFFITNFFTGGLVSFTTVWFAIFFYYFAAKTRKIEGNAINYNTSI